MNHVRKSLEDVIVLPLDPKPEVALLLGPITEAALKICTNSVAVVTSAPIYPVPVGSGEGVWGVAIAWIYATGMRSFAAFVKTVTIFSVVMMSVSTR